MSRGKYLSLEEARQSGAFKRFCAEHRSKAERERFLKLLMVMSQGALEGEETFESGSRTRVPAELELAEVLSEMATRHMHMRSLDGALQQRPETPQAY